MKYLLGSCKILSHDEIEREYENKKKIWEKELIDAGYKAARPYDGCVNKEAMWFKLKYRAHFDIGVCVGDKVMLGWHDMEQHNLSVIVTSIVQKRRFDSVRYYYDVLN